MNCHRLSSRLIEQILLGIVHKLRSRWGGGPPPHVVDYVTTTVRRGGGTPPPPHPHVVDYGNFFWSCFIQCWVWGGTPPPHYRSRNVVDYVGGGVPPILP